MLIQGGVSPRTTSRVDLPLQNPHRPCRPPPPEDLLTFEEDVVFEWSKSIPPDIDESRKSRTRNETRKTTDSHLPGLFAEVIGESLSHRPTSGSISTLTSSRLLPTAFDRRGSIGDVSSRAASRCESAQVSAGAGSLLPQRCSTAPPFTDYDAEIDGGVSGSNVVDVVTEHEIRTRERSKSCRLYGEHSRHATEFTYSGSARKPRQPNEERYLQTRYRERPCSRAESFVNEDLFDTTSDLSRECCDVLGPRHCYDCFRITQRNEFVHRNKSAFPSIHTNPKTLSTITLVQRLFPELSTLDILEGVADGYISSRSFSRDRLLEICERKKAEARRKEITEKWKGAAKRRISAFSVPDKMRFFSNFADLRAQILKQRGSYTGFKGTLFPMTNLQQLPPPTEIELVIRKEEDRENPANYFDPPLMTREEIQRQKSQPRFYAGTDQEYKLPDAPPLTEILHKTNKAIRDMDSESLIKTPGQGAKPCTRRVETIPGHGSQSKSKAIGSIGGSDGIFGKAHGRSRPPRLGRPDIGGGFARKSLASSFSRPLQMETLTEDGNQSEKEELMEEEEEEEENQEKITGTFGQAKRVTFQRPRMSHTDLLQEEEEEEEEEDEGGRENNDMILEEEDEEEDEQAEVDGLGVNVTDSRQFSRELKNQKPGTVVQKRMANISLEEAMEEEEEDDFDGESSVSQSDDSDINN